VQNPCSSFSVGSDQTAPEIDERVCSWFYCKTRNLTVDGAHLCFAAVAQW
jgi:hypothetical protein